MQQVQDRTQLRHRLQVAGANSEPSFDFEAIRLIYEYAYGIPRLVNQAGDMALLAAYARGHQRVDADAAGAAIRELKGICS